MLRGVIRHRRYSGQNKTELDLLVAIANKWGVMSYHAIGNTTQICQLFKATKNLKTDDFTMEILGEINVSDPSIQNDWIICRDILCRTQKEALFYETELARVHAEVKAWLKTFPLNLIFD
jgi:hypothetical protein